MSYKVKLPVFEGPFDLLFHLVQKQEIDIWSISIAEITDQYLRYLQTMEELNLEIASEFLVMAATLLRLKSKRLLPAADSLGEEEDAEDLFAIESTEDLIRRVLEYRLFKEVSAFLQEKEEEQHKVFFRSGGGSPHVLRVAKQESFWEETEDPEKLARLFQDLQEKELQENTRHSFSVTEEYGLHEKMGFIRKKLRESKRPFYFKSLMERNSLEEIIITFFALLEMSHQGEVKVWQEQKFGPIIIEGKEG